MVGSGRAGAATADITPPIGVPLGGYGRRQGGATGVMKPLLVRVLVLADGEREIAVAVCDLLGVGRDLVAGARRHVEAQTGIPADHVLVAATHTHGGPAHLRAVEDEHYVDVTARTIAGAVVSAHRQLQPVTLKFGTVDVATISQNRRDPAGPVETIARVLLVDTPQPGPPVATLVNFACHATVLEWDNLQMSPDFPGAMARRVEQSLGGTAIYLQGACGDVNPVWSRHDEAEVERVGGVLAGAATRLAHEMRPLDTGQWCVNLSWSEDIEVRGPGFLVEPLDLGVARTLLELDRRPRQGLEEVSAELAELEAALAARPGPLGRGLRARINELSTARLFPPLGPGQATQPLEVQAIRLSPQCAIVTLPGEFFAETGQAIVRRCGLDGLLVAGYANGSVGYVPPAVAFPEAGYEVGMTQFGPEAEGVIADAAVEAVRGLYPGS
jgi:neutral ceramidase